MKITFKILTLLILCYSITFGMGKQPPPPPPPFVSASATGPPHQAPLFLVDTSSVTIYSQVSFYAPASIEGKINAEGTRTVSIKGQNKNNFNWDISRASINTGLSVKIWETQEVFTTLKIDSRENGISFAGSDFGLSFLMNPKEDFRLRLDLGLSYVSMDVETYLLKEDDYTGDTTISSSGNSKGLGPFASLTMQAAFDDWTIHPFFQASYCRLPVFSIDGYNKEIYYSLNSFTLTPGITYRIGENILLMMGGSYSVISQIENSSSPGIFSGFAQANFLF